MSDIELVIKIDEELLNNYVIIQPGRSSGMNIVSKFLTAIKNGTPLPKGHGKLIDVGQCNRKLFYQQCGGANSLITVKSAFDMLMLLPPIIEANKEGEE